MAGVYFKNSNIIFKNGDLVWESSGVSLDLLPNSNYTVYFEVTNSLPTLAATIYIGTESGCQVYGNGYFTQNIISSGGTPVFNPVGSVSNYSIYVESNFQLSTDQIELSPIWQNLMILYAVFSGLFKDKRYNQSRAVESIYRGELPFLKQIIEVETDSKSDMVYK